MASLNAPPEYYAAEARYRAAKTFEEKKAALEEMLRLCPKHKGAQKILMEIKNKLARLRKEREIEEKKARARKGGRGEAIRKQGFQVVLFGPANSGKTALFNALTGRSEKSTPVPFETSEVVPGIMGVKKVNVQVIDTPSITEENKARVLGLARAGDLAVAVVESEGQKKFFGDPALVEKTIFLIHGRDYDAFDEKSVEAVKEKMFSALNIIRVFTKPPGSEPDYEKPVALRRGSTVADAAKEISKEIAETLKYARVWGSARFPGQQAGADYVLADGDVVEFHAQKRVVKKTK